MKYILRNLHSYAISALFFLSIPATANADSPHGETVRLFNGKDFTGLAIYDANQEQSVSDSWIVEGEILRCSGIGKGYIRTIKAYADYELSFDWRWPEVAGNSGVLLHLVGEDKLWPKSFEAQLKSDKAGDFASFSDARSDNEIVSRNPKGISTGRLPRPGASTEKAIGEWNHFVITCSGDTITLVVNGKQQNQMTGVIPSGGMIGFQSEGAAIEFRNINLKHLGPAKDLHAPMPSQH